MNFSNAQVHSDDLPQIEKVLLKPISKHYLKIIFLNKMVMFFIFYGILFLGKFIIRKESFQDNFWIFFILLTLFFVIHFIIVFAAFKKRKYAIRENDVIYSQGLFVNSITTVPISRIQHIEESRSFLARQLNLATLKIFTAGDSGSDLSIHGLPNEEAKRINLFLSGKVDGK